MNDTESTARIARGPGWKMEAAALIFGLALGGGWEAAHAHLFGGRHPAPAHVTHDRDP